MEKTVQVGTISYRRYTGFFATLKLFKLHKDADKGCLRLADTECV